MRFWFALFALPVILSGCVSPRAVHTPPPPTPVPVVRPPAPPTTTDWRDIPLTLGDWRYAAEGGQSIARFGPAGAQPQLVARCDPARRIVSIERAVAVLAPGAATMAITTSAGNRALAVTAVPGALAASLPARDPLLDKMAFSRGRFVVAVTGTVRLVIPAWPEFARIIEDCRG